MCLEIFKDKKLLLVFCICFFYWTCLFFAAEMHLAMDAVGYQRISEMIAKKGWAEYFRTGPNVEPLYPFLVSISMNLADQFSISFTEIQKAFQFFLLFCTQILSILILQKLQVRPLYQALTALYIGFSPALVNTALSLFTEITTYPFLLGIVLLNLCVWKAIHNESIKKVALLSIGAGFLYLLAVFARGGFLSILYVFMAMYLFFALIFLFKKEGGIFKKSLVHILITLLIAQSFLISFSLLNKKYNGLFAYTFRFEGLFYANATKRTRPLTSKIFLSHIAAVPGEGVCRMFFSDKECEYTGLREQDDISGLQLNKTLLKYPKEQHNALALKWAFEKIKERPFHYLLFTSIEAMRIFFWESTHVGYVIYPDWLKTLFDYKPFSYGIRLLVSLVSIGVFLYFLQFVLFSCKEMFKKSFEDDQIIISFFILLVSITYIFGVSLVTILVRYAIPLGPIFLIMFAFWLEKRSEKRI